MAERIYKEVIESEMCRGVSGADRGVREGYKQRV